VAYLRLFNCIRIALAPDIGLASELNAAYNKSIQPALTSRLLFRVSVTGPLMIVVEAVEKVLKA
jgi:hypothetical protein